MQKEEKIFVESIKLMILISFRFFPEAAWDTLFYIHLFYHEAVIVLIDISKFLVYHSPGSADNVHQFCWTGSLTVYNCITMVKSIDSVYIHCFHEMYIKSKMCKLNC